MVIEVVQLTSDSHHKNILTSLHQLRLQGHLNDVTLQVDHQGDVQEFQAHQVILAASSGYFRKMLLSPDVARDKLLLSNMNSSDFSKFLEFVYTGRVEVARENIGDVEALAQHLDCDDLAQVCREAMSAGIVPKLQIQTSVSDSVGVEGLRNAKKKNKAKEKKQRRTLRVKRKRSPQDSEMEVVSKRTRSSASKKKFLGVRLKMSLAGRKVLSRRLHAKKGAFMNEDEVSSDDVNEDTTEADAPLEINEEALLGNLTSDADDMESDNDWQSNDHHEHLATPGGEEEEEEGDDDDESEGDGEEGQPVQKKKTSKSQFQCKKCQRTFHYERSFLKHISTYHGVKAAVVYRCETCLQTFANRSNLKIHEKHVHSSERQFSCSSCSKTFKRKKDVVRHQRQVHERNLQHVCPVCGKALSSKTALLLHERTHTGLKPFECPDCRARFTQNSALKMHRRTHTGEKPFACDECEARFTQKHMLAYHKRSHSERPFMCEACGKSFASKEYLRHHSNIHTGSKPYKCEQCGRCFTQRNSLNQHLKIHTGERPYSCKECDKQFTQLNALQRHQRIHTGEKPYMCSLCKRTFTDKSTLRRHTTIHDSDAPWKTYLVVLEGNVEEKKPKSPTKGKAEKAGPVEKKTTARKSPSAEADAESSRPEIASIEVPAEQVTLPTDWASHGAIALVSHGALGGITVIHTEVPPGTQLQPIMTTDGTGASVISLDGSTIPFSIPVSVSSGVPSTSLSMATLSVPVSSSLLASVSEIPTVSTSVLETAASQTILAHASDSTVTLPPDIQTVIVDDEICRREKIAVGEGEEMKETGDELAAGPEGD